MSKTGEKNLKGELVIDGRFEWWSQKTITMRIDLDNLDWLQSVGKKNYQSRLNNALRWARLNNCPVAML